jgi:hypothetical protein
VPRTWAAFVDAVIPETTALADTVALLVVVAGLALSGAWIGGRRRIAEIDLIVGWGVACAAFTVLAVATDISFTAIAVAAALAAAVGAVAVYRRDGRLAAPGTLRLFGLTLPAILIVGAMTPTQWDELVHWLPNARYLVEHDRFPALDRPASPSAFPGYPHGTAFVIYLASRLVGRLAESAGALFNVVLWLSFALFLTRIAREAYESGGDGNDGRSILEPPRRSLPWGWCALAVLAVTALNPTFVAKIVFSAYGETATAVAAGASLAVAWCSLNALAAGDPTAAQRHAWYFGLVSAALLSVKQANVALFAAILAGAAVVVACDPRIRLREVCRLAPAALAVPVATYAAWRLHIAFALPGSDFPLRSLSEWFWPLLPDIVERMALIASKKGGYFLIMLAALAFAIRGARRTPSAFDRLAIMTATLFVLYTGFLLFTYLAAFGDYEAVRAASYWRYNMHLGGAALVFVVFGVARLVRDRNLSFLPRRAMRAAGGALAVTIVLAPIVFVERLRFDLDPGYRYIRNVAADMARQLRPDQRLVAFDPKDNGQYLMLLRYGMHGSAQVTDLVNAFFTERADLLRRIVEKRNATHLWLRRPDVESTAVHGLALAPGSSYLLARQDGAWVVERSWPDGGADAQRAGRD